MSLQITGTVKTVLDETTGVSGAGKEWRKQSFVVTYKDGNYDKDVAITGMNDKCDVIGGLRSGQAVTVYFNVSSREYNGKWYTDCSMWKVDAGSVQSQSPVPPPLHEQANDLLF